MRLVQPGKHPKKGETHFSAGMCACLSALETVLSGFFGSVGIWPNHPVSSDMWRKAREVLAECATNKVSSGEARRIGTRVFENGTGFVWRGVIGGSGPGAGGPGIGVRKWDWVRLAR